MKAIRVIPAAGAGRRMGRTKALLDFDGASALELITRLDLAGLIAADVVVAGHDAARVVAEAERLGRDSVVNTRWERGQTGSLQAGITRALQIGCTHVVVHPVDLPLVSQATYDACAAATATAEITVPSFDRRRGHPLIVVSAIAEDIGALAQDRPARDVVRAHAERISHVEVDDSWVVRDLDTPEDYDAALTAYRGR